MSLTPRSSEPRSPILTWPNCEHLLVARGETAYAWISPDENSVPVITDKCAVGDGEPAGVVIHGDGLDAIEALAHRGDIQPGTVRLVYIDPPFGAHKRFGAYNDTLDPATWLSMLRDRLVALQPYLGPDASVWVHLDESMSHLARLVMDQVFGARNYVATVIWQKRLTVESRTAISVSHDPILVYSTSGPKHWKTTRNRITGAVSASNQNGDARGPWRDAPFTAPGYRSGQQYAIVNPSGVTLSPPRGRSWFATEPAFRRMLDEDRIWWTKDGAGQPRMKNFSVDAEQVPGTIWSGREVGTNDDAKRHLAALFHSDERVFDTPKPEQLLQRILHIGSDPGDLIVDLFGGSGTTAAVAHKMGRRWITSERMSGTVSRVLVPRLTSVVTGRDPGGITGDVGWTGGRSFEVVTLQPSPAK